MLALLNNYNSSFMNNNLKNSINKVSNVVGYFVSSSVKSFASLLRMLLLSSPSVAVRSGKYKKYKNSETCCVLGNGPSLKEALNNNEVVLEGVDVFAVNMFCSSESFPVIKPQFYFLVDSAYFSPQDERNEKLVDILIEKLNMVDWHLYLVISSTSAKGRLLQNLHNPNVDVIRMNSTTIEGFRFLNHFLYRIRMGMPRCQTVVNFALMTGIDMGYKSILLYGADHTWTRDLFVDDDNVVCYGDRHVYNTGLTIIKKEGTIAHLLRQFAMMFETHHEINEFAESVGCSVINCTKGSFVDAYQRKK